MITRGIFKANDIRGVTEGPTRSGTPRARTPIGAALVDTLDLNAAEGALVVGRDMRVSGPAMSAAFIDGVLSRGADVVDIGLASTDQLWFASGRLGLPGAMFTASHNPAEYNGIKFCLAGARPIAPAQLVEIADRALAGEPVPARRAGRAHRADLLAAYADHLHSLVDLTGIRRLTVVVDAGNGMAGHTLPAVLGAGRPGAGRAVHRSRRHASPTTSPTRSSRRTCSTPRPRSSSTAPTWRWSSTATPTGASSSTSAATVVTPSAVTAMIASQELDREPGGDHRDATRSPPGRCRRSSPRPAARSWSPRSATPSSRRRWPSTGRSSAASTPRTTTSATSGAPTPGCWPRCTSSPWPVASDRPLSELVARFDRYAASGEINSTVADQQSVMEKVAAAFAGRGTPGLARRPDRGRAGLVGQRPAQQHRAAAPAERRGARASARWPRCGTRR